MIVIFLCGCLVGTMGAFLGIGGGVIIIPLLTILLGYSIHEAVATSLAIVVANSIATSYKYMGSGMVNLRLGLTIAVFSILGSLIGGAIGLNASARVLYLTLGIAQIITAVLMLKKRKAQPPSYDGGFLSGEFYDQAGKCTVRYTPKNLPPTFGVAGVSGILSGMVGVGGGVFVVPAMNIIARVPIKAATATSGFIMGFTAAGGGLLFFLHGYTQTDVVAAMVPGVFISTHIASRFFTKINSVRIYQAFVIFLIIIAIQMIYRGVIT